MDINILERQLVECSSATIAQECGCCSLVYCIVLPDGTRWKGQGTRHFSFPDERTRPLFEARYVVGWFEAPYMEVTYSNTPPLRIRKKGIMSRSILILNETDTPVLKIRMPIWLWPGAEYLVLGSNNTEVCKITKDWAEYDVTFPVDLDVRYKAALLASCIFMDFLRRRR